MREHLKRQKADAMVNKVTYNNCMILSKDGNRAFICNQEKANWYIKEGHGHKVKDEPFTVMLNFEE